MYTVLFWKNFKKRDNSTLIPTGSTTLIYDCDFLDGSGIISPTIKLRVSNPTEWNFAYIPTFKRYYKVTNWRYETGLWIADLQVDVLASWAGEIEKQEVYVLRSASKFNGRIVDNAYPIIGRKTFDIGAMAEGSANPFATAYNNGYFVVGIVNTDTTSIGAVSYYVFTPTQFKTLVDKLLGNVSYYNVSDISDDLTKLLANPFQYVVSCYWFPFAPPMAGTVNTLNVGWWSFNITCNRLSGYTMAAFTGPTIEVPKHPEALTRGYYLLTEPYTEYYLYLPPWGSFSLPAEKLIDSDYITCSSRIDCITGMGTLRINPQGSNAALTVVNAQIGVPIMLAQMAPQLGNLMNQMQTVASSSPVLDYAASVIGSTFVNPWQIGKDLNSLGFAEAGNKIINIASNVGTMMLSKYCPSQTLGNNGGVMAGYDNPQLYASFSYQADMNIEEKGRPLCERIRLSKLSGFVQCGETDINIPCTKSENDAIRMYMSSGFFLE